MRHLSALAVVVVLGLATMAGSYAFPPEAVTAWREGRWLLDNHRPSAAVAAFTQAIAIDPSFGEAWFHRGAAWYQRGESDRLRGYRVRPDDCQRALADLERALELGVPRAEVLHARGLVHADLLDWWRALRDYDEALRCIPLLNEPPEARARRFAFIYNDRGNAWAKLGRFREAVREYTRAIASNQSRFPLDRADIAWYHAQFCRNRARVLTMIGRTMEARRDMKEALKAEVAGPQLHPRSQR